MISVQDLAKALDPSKTVIFLGAGASMASGAPSGAGLSGQLVDALDPDSGITGDLTEVSSILELRRGRPELIRSLRSILEPLQPTGGMEALPEFDWSAIYTTNYDYLVERSYERAGREIAVSRSNFDYANTERNPDATPYYKIHGCLSQDLVDGHKSRLVLTEGDYDEYSNYREVLFKKLDLDLDTKDLVVIGSSLRDPHIKAYMDQAARLHREKHTPGRLFALIYERDEDRAALLERRGYSIAFGDLDSFTHNLTQNYVPMSTGVPSSGFTLPAALRPKVVTVAHARGLASNVSRLYNGSPGTYGDVANGLTFKREIEDSVGQAFTHRERLAVTITGAGGVGKTTLARRVLSHLEEVGYACWEHNSNFPFLRSEWMEAEALLRAQDQYGVLLIDDCAPVLSQVNRLLEDLARLENSALLVMVTAASSQWRPRTKSPVFFTHGETFELSQLSDADLHELLNLVERQSVIRDLTAPGFSLSTRSQRFTLLRRRCAADMYVCLKNVFATESLDGILLREYAELTPENQDIYRLVAALEATGAQVHRQLIFRLLAVDAGIVQALLQLLEGIVDEFDIKPREGLYGLSTRHRVIAQTITKYKYADEDERHDLFARVIDVLNPTVFLELRLVREICDKEYGIGSLTSDERQIQLYRSLISVAPGERIPRHRLIAKYLYTGELDLAERELADAWETVKPDPPLARYGVLLLKQRASDTPGIMDEDRHALLLQADSKAREAVRRFPNDPYVYGVRGDVALAIAELTGDVSGLDDSIQRLEEKYSELREPNMQKSLRRLRDARRTFRDVPGDVMQD